MPDRYSNQSARDAGPYDDETPMHVQERMVALEKLVHDQYQALAVWYAGHRGRCGSVDEGTESLQRRACELLDLDPPGCDCSGVLTT